MSVFNASIVALFLEYRAWTDLRASCLDLIHQPYVRIFRARWVDDLFLLFATRFPLSNIQCAGIQMRFTDAYSPFGLKVEDASTFVGLNVDCQGSKLQLLLLPHSLFPCVHGMLRYTPRRTERMDVLVLRKGTGAVALSGAVARAQLC